MSILSTVVVALLSLAVSSSVAGAQDGRASGIEVSVLTEDVHRVWDVAFTEDGRAFVTERDTGRLLEIGDDGAVTEVRHFAVNSEGEGGLLGLTVGPNDGLFYAYLSTHEDNRVVRFSLEGAVEPILTGIPRARTHNGGRIDFGPDGFLYVTTGDARQPEAAQDPESLAGKILRITADGQIPADNPASSPVYALGLRNTQGLAWDSTGRLFASEFGPGVDDEINLIVAGGNYGWPEVTGRAGGDEFIDPVIVRQPNEASWSGIAILQGSAIPRWNNTLLVAALRGERLWQFNIRGQKENEPPSKQHLVGEHGRLRHVAQAPDGSVWVLTSNSPDDNRILRLTRSGHSVGARD